MSTKLDEFYTSMPKSPKIKDLITNSFTPYLERGVSVPNKYMTTKPSKEKLNRDISDSYSEEFDEYENMPSPQLDDYSPVKSKDCLLQLLKSESIELEHTNQ